MDLYIDLTNQRVYKDRLGSQGEAIMDANQGDKMRARVWLMESVEGPSIRAIVPIPSPYTLLNISGKAKSALSAVTPLFTVGDWTTVSVVFNEGEEDEYTEVHYESDISFNTTQVADVLDPEGGAPVDQFEFFWSLSFSNGAVDEDWLGWTPIPRGNGIMLRDIFPDGGAAPEDADPPYPDADQLAPVSGSNYQFALVSGSWEFQVKNTTTDAFHKVTIEGASGAEQLVIHEAT